MKIRIVPYWKRQDGWIEWVALAASLIGTAASMKGQSDVQKAQDRERANTLYNLGLKEQKARTIVARETQDAGADKAKPAIDAAAAERAAAYNRITAPSAQPTQTQTVSRTVSTPFAAATANQLGISNAWNRIIGTAQAKAGAYQDWGLARNIAQQRAGQEIGLIGRNAQGSARVSAAEQEAASRAGDGLAAAGSLIGVAGKGLGAYAATAPSGGGGGGGYNPKMDSYDYDPNITYVNSNTA